MTCCLAKRSWPIWNMFGAYEDEPLACEERFANYQQKEETHHSEKAGDVNLSQK